MSAQVTDKQVNKVNSVFFQDLKHPQDWAKLGAAKISEYIKTISFYKNKSRFIFQTSNILLEKYNGEVPITLEELTALPWVGIKTAKVFLGITQDAPYLWVDTHVHRVLNRTGIVNSCSPLETDKVAERVLKKEDLASLHHTLIFFGRYHCIARKPKCQECELTDFCKYYKQNNKKTA
jgi:endonuclease-3